MNKIAKNALLIFGSNIFSKVLGFVFIIIIARALTVEDFGLYSAVTAFPVMFLAFSDFGITSFLNREFSANSNEAMAKWFLNCKTIKAVLSFITIALVSGALIFLQYPSEFVVLGIITTMALVADSYAGLYRGLFMAKEDFGLDFKLTALQKIIFVFGSIGLVFLGFGVFEIIALMLASSAISLFVTLYVSGTFLEKIGVYDPKLPLA